jgi:transcriptional regulator with XRE-family HTH domain
MEAFMNPNARRKLKIAAIMKDLSYRDLATLTGRSLDSVKSVMSGRSNPSREFAQELGRVLGVSYTKLWPNTRPYRKEK